MREHITIVDEVHATTVADQVYSIVARDIVEVVQAADFVVAGAQERSLSKVFTASENISGHRVVSSMGENIVGYSDADDAATMGVVGVSSHAATTGNGVNVTLNGFLSHDGWDWTIGEPIYVGSNGGLTQSPSGSAYLSQVGVATASNAITINIQQPILL